MLFATHFKHARPGQPVTHGANLFMRCPAGRGCFENVSKSAGVAPNQRARLVILLFDDALVATHPRHLRTDSTLDLCIFELWARPL